GGAGFIGSNLVNRLLREGHQVTILDSLSRSGGNWNISWLQEKYGADSFNLIQANIADFDAVKRGAEGHEF
ncbi:MAG: NAD-dependent epimerase/dehydratase family protein, partial [Moorea sp. SIO2B7]|nr:NAD-dependent epimerase/dehydratase family protein [Moorena sp. SIO2B7]